jgi:hypothetical protein
MGSSIASGFSRQGTSDSFYGNRSAPTVPERPAGRRSMPGGPLLPELPRNPLATVARRMTQRSFPLAIRRSGRIS